MADIKKLLERMELAKDARCQGEADAITHYNYEPGEAECSNCGQAFPPENPEQEGSRVWCSNWNEHQSAMYFCRAWLHETDFAAGIAPPWAKAYTRERLDLETLEGEALLKEMDAAIPTRL